VKAVIRSEKPGMLARRMNKDAKNSKEFVKFTIIPANETLLSENGEEQTALLPGL
jgi:hypothetical protein